MCSVAKRIIIITQGISPVVNPLVESGVCNVIGIIECAPRKKKKKCILDTVRKNKMLLIVMRTKKVSHIFIWKNQMTSYEIGCKFLNQI